MTRAAGDDLVEREYRCPCGRARLHANDRGLREMPELIARVSCRWCLRPASAFVLVDGTDPRHKAN